MSDYRAQEPSRAAEAIAAWRPLAHSAQVADFARAAARRSGPESPARAKAFLFAASRLGAFAESVGLELDVESLFQEHLIERLCAASAGTFSAATLRTLRCNLRTMARLIERGPLPAPARLPRERAKAPYPRSEIEGFLHLAGALSTPARQWGASALICLGAGAGLVGAELRGVRGSDVIERSGGLVVEVGGARARAVPVIADYRHRLAAAARFAGDELIIGGQKRERRNLSEELCRALSGDPGLGRLEVGRLRSTWLSECAEAIGLGAFMTAAGVRCSQRLGDIAASLPALAEPATVRLLGGADG